MSLTTDPFLPVQHTRQISGTMGKFEDLFQDLDVHTEVMDSTMSAATTLNTPEDQVTGLMKEVRVMPTAREGGSQAGRDGSQGGTAARQGGTAAREGRQPGREGGSQAGRDGSQGGTAAREAARQGGTVAPGLHMFGYLLSSIILLSPPLRMEQVAEENGLEVLDQLSANPVSTREPTAATAGADTLSTAEEDQLSRRYMLHLSLIHYTLHTLCCMWYMF